MRKVLLLLCTPLAGCLAPETSGLSEEAPIASTQMAVKSIDPETARWIEENVPVWHVYLGGKGHDLHPGKDPWNRFTNVYYDHPPDSDVFAPIILVKKGDEDKPERWIQLSLTSHWQMGQRYFDELMECNGLTPLDFLVIMGELSKYADKYTEPPPIHILPAATHDALRALRGRSRQPCKRGRSERLYTFAGGEHDPYGPPLPPGWVGGPDTHTYGPGPSGPVAGSGRPLPPDVTPEHPSLSQAPPNPAPPQTPEHNGVLPGDPEPEPAPTDGSHKPRPGEQKEVFKCNGAVFYGYKAGCVDLSNRSVAQKWIMHGSQWPMFDHREIRDWMLHSVYHDGKNPECTVACNRVSNLVCTTALSLAAVICTAVTDGACFGSIIGGVSTFAVGQLGNTQCLDVIREHCASDVCTK